MTESDGGRRINVTFSPPTPNGDFHLGHLAGPLLGSDICARAQKILGNDVAFSTSTDDNQTYVVTTARRLGVSPEDLIGDAYDAMTASLKLAGIDVDIFDRPDEEYVAYVRDFFTLLWSNDAFERREVELPYDPDTGEYKAEAFVTGRCPVCLAHARAGVCEACGLYNLPAALLPDAGGGAELPRVTVSIWVLDLERYRDLITAHYAAVGQPQRPDLARVVSTALASRLPYIPITYPVRWGITVNWDAAGGAAGNPAVGRDGVPAGDPVGDPPQAINAWPEIYAGHRYWLARARRDREPRDAGVECDELVQFIGIDNGFYNAFVYVTLELLAARHGLPKQTPKTRTITNQYFMLVGRKFSTSKGDVRWAGEFLRDTGRDRARFVLALTSPELQRSEFSDPVARFTLDTRFDQPLATITRGLNESLAGRRVQAQPTRWWCTALETSRRRFEDAYRLETFSIRDAAEALAQHLEVLAFRAGQIRRDDPADVSGALLFLWQLRTLAWPVTPDLSEEVSRAFGAAPMLDQSPLLTEATLAPAGAFLGLPPLRAAEPAESARLARILAAEPATASGVQR
jgi:methionyl-tRNA synthetase